MGAGAFTVSGVYIQRRHRDPSGAFSYLDLGAAKSTSYHIELQKEVKLEPCDRVYVNVDGYTSTQDLRLHVDYRWEYIR